MADGQETRSAANVPLGRVSLWRDLHARHWMLYALGFVVHFYAEHGRPLYFLRYPRWDHPNSGGIVEFRRCWRVF